MDEYDKGLRLVIELAEDYGRMKRIGDSASIERSHGRYHAACEMFAIFTNQTTDDVIAVTFIRYVEGLGERLF
jgi:hypothetical protein